MASNTDHFDLPPPVMTVPARLLIVVAPYYKAIAEDLEAGARHAILAAGAGCETVLVPGALEIPPAIGLAAAEFDGFVALGCVIRGETSHYDTVCNESARGLMDLGLRGLCIGNGILTVENLAQAEVRADRNGQNKGGGAALAALHLIALRRKLKG